MLCAARRPNLENAAAVKPVRSWVRCLDRHASAHRSTSRRTSVIVQPPKPAPVSREPRTPGTDAGDVDQRVQLRTADLVQIAQRRVALVEQLADRLEVRRLHRLDRRDHAIVTQI